MDPSTFTQSSSTQRNSTRRGRSLPGPQSPPSGREPDAGDEPAPSPQPRLPSRVAPFDLGDGKDKITRALELNRQLLLASQQEPLVDEPAVRAKVDELLGRLLKLG